MAQRKYPRSRFFFSLRHSPLVSIQMTPEVAERMKPIFCEIFGVKFLSSEYMGNNGVIHYDFKADKKEVEKIKSAFERMINERVVKDIDIEMTFN